MVSESVAAGTRQRSRQDGSAQSRSLYLPDPRRLLQLALAAIWLIDAVLQFQSFMFSKGFSQMLAGTASGNPAVIADPVTWAAKIVEQHPVPANAAFATIQLLIGLGIACRPTIRAALAASVVWSVAVWWFGEGLGGVLSGGASPVNGAPGAVILYALLAVLLWPVGDDEAGQPGRGATFVAARPVGPAVARALWVILWGSLAYFSVTSANRAAQGLHDMVAGMADGQPGWLGAINRGAGDVLAHNGLAASVVLAVLLGVVAIGIFGPLRAHRAAIVLAIVLALLIWVVGEDLGQVLAGGATDVNSGPLLALIALAYWPLSPASRRLTDPAEETAS